MSLTSYRTALPRNLFSLRGGRRYRFYFMMQGGNLFFYSVDMGSPVLKGFMLVLAGRTLGLETGIVAAKGGIGGVAAVLF